MSASYEVSSLGSHSSRRPDAYSNDARQGSGEGDACRDASQQLLQHASHDDHNDAMSYHDKQHAKLASQEQIATRTTRPGSSRPSTFSYDSLEQSPIHDLDLPPATVKPNSRHKPKRWCRLPTSIWTTEVLSCVIALLCLGAIIAILSVHQGLPLPQWPCHITINALISVFTAIFKMALTMPIAEGKQDNLAI